MLEYKLSFRVYYRLCNRSCQAWSSSGLGTPANGLSMMKEPLKATFSYSTASRAGAATPGEILFCSHDWPYIQKIRRGP